MSNFIYTKIPIQGANSHIVGGPVRSRTTTPNITSYGVTTGSVDPSPPINMHHSTYNGASAISNHPNSIYSPPNNNSVSLSSLHEFGKLFQYVNSVLFYI